MKTLNIYTVKERKPKHGEEIIWFKSTSCFGYEEWEGKVDNRVCEALMTWEVEPYG